MTSKKVTNAIENLNKKYSKKFYKAILKMLFFAILKAAAIVVTFFFFAYKVNSPAGMGGPSELLRLIGILYAATAIFVSMLPAFRLKSKLDKEYRREKLWLSLRSFG